MTKSAAALARGWQCHQAGDLQQAERIYREVLQADPGHAEAWYLLGVVYQNLGNVDDAVACYRRALEIKPDYTEVHNNLGVIYSTRGMLDEAIATYRQAIQCNPGNAEAYQNLGIDLAQKGQLDEAVVCYREALRIRPSYAEAYENLKAAEAARQARTETGPSQVLWSGIDPASEHNNQGIALGRQGRLDEAVARFQEALLLQPSFAEAYNNLGLVLVEKGNLNEAIACYRQALRFRPEYHEAFNNLGIARGRQGRLDEAANCYRQALQLRPDYAPAHNNLAVILERQNRLDDAVAHYREALRLTPDLAAAHNNLGVIHERQGKLDEAEASYRRALQLQPAFADAYNNLGNVFRDQLRFADAEVCFQRALQARPDYADAHLNRALVSLQHGDFKAGWPGYEWRLRRSDLVPRTFREPTWNGVPLEGRAILLHAEQGLGDTLHFVRYAALVRDRGGRVLLECQRPLQQLLARCPGVEQVIPQGAALPPFDVQAPLLGLPGIFQTTLASIPAQVPYVFADPVLEARWREELQAIRAFKIGIAWQGNPNTRDNWQRAIPLASFAPLAGLPGVQLVSLQKGPGIEQISAQAKPLPILDLGPRLDEDSGPFMDTAAVMRALDLVVTSDSAVAHLAGALGVPVWVALPFSPDWRWLLDRDNSPWYPTMRLFRQGRAGQWGDVFERMAGELGKKVGTG